MEVLQNSVLNAWNVVIFGGKNNLDNKNRDEFISELLKSFLKNYHLLNIETNDKFLSNIIDFVDFLFRLTAEVA